MNGWEKRSLCVFIWEYNFLISLIEYWQVCFFYFSGSFNSFRTHFLYVFSLEKIVILWPFIAPTNDVVFYSCLLAYVIIDSIHTKQNKLYWIIDKSLGKNLILTIFAGLIRSCILVNDKRWIFLFCYAHIIARIILFHDMSWSWIQ